MRTADLDYGLPPGRVAQEPVEPRDAARLLVDRGPGQPPDDHRVADLPDLLRPGDLLVVNATRVIPARVHLCKPTGGRAEVLFLERRDEPSGWWEALVRPDRRLPVGSVLAPEPGRCPTSGGGALPDRVEVGARLGDGRRLVRLLPATTGIEEDLTRLARLGELPLPPYIHTPLARPDRYQTVYARHPGSVAAPTAGLHLTEAVLGRLAERQVGLAEIDLQVGIGTFRPINTDRVEDHHMHGERYRVPLATLDACRRARRVVALGTTTVRALESAARRDASGGSAADPAGSPVGGPACIEGVTDLFIRPGFEFHLVDLLVTNFHQPRSSLLVMIEAFVGPRWRQLYRHALDHGYRFLSLGDAMLLARHDASGATGPAAAR